MAVTASIGQRRRLIVAFKFIINHNHPKFFDDLKVQKSSHNLSFYSTLCKYPCAQNFRVFLQAKRASMLRNPSISITQLSPLQCEVVYDYIFWLSVSSRQIYSGTLPGDEAQFYGAEEHMANRICNPLAKDSDEVCRLLSDYRSPHHDLEKALDKCCVRMLPDLVEQVLKRCCTLGVPAHRFFVWAGRQPGYKHSSVVCNIMIDILGSIRQFDSIWHLLTEMKNEGISISHRTFAIVIKRYARAHLAENAIQSFRAMERFDCKPDLEDLNTLLTCLCKNKLVSDAHRFFEDTKGQFQPSVKTYSILIKAWGDGGNLAQAQRTFKEMIDQKCVPDIVAYNNMLSCLCKGGKLGWAYQFLDELKSRGPVPNVCTYSIFINAHCESGQMDEAFKVLDRMKRYGFVPNVITYNSLIRGFCKIGKLDYAYWLLDEMACKGVAPDVWSYNAIHRVHCKLHEVKKAVRLLRRMDDNGCKPDVHTYNMLIKMLVSIGRFDRVLEVWDSMEKRGFYPAVTTYAAVIHGLCKKRKYNEACKYFEDMIHEGIPPYPCTCELLKNCLLQSGERIAVQILAEKMQGSSSCSIQELSKTMGLLSYNMKGRPKITCIR